MTYEELLAKVNGIYVDYLDVAAVNGIKALRAVVELHKPVEHAEGTWCSGCMATEWYPCPTIQAIEKELG